MPVDGARGGVGDGVQLIDERHGDGGYPRVTPRDESPAVTASAAWTTAQTDFAPRSGRPAVRGREVGDEVEAEAAEPGVAPLGGGRRHVGGGVADGDQPPVGRGGSAPRRPAGRRAAGRWSVSSSAMSTSRSDQCSRSGCTTVGLPVRRGAQPGAQLARARRGSAAPGTRVPGNPAEGAPVARAPPSPPRRRGLSRTGSPRHGSGARSYGPCRCPFPACRPTPVSPGSCTDRCRLGSRSMQPTRSAPPAPAAERVLAGLGGVGGALPRGRQRRGGPGPRRLPRPAAGRARPERRRRRRPGRRCRAGCGWNSPATTLPGRQHRRPAGRRRACRGWPRCARRPSGTRTRASGRFGVGFAAVLAVSDEPAVLSDGRRGAVQRRPDPGRGRRAAAASPTSWRGAGERCRCCGCRGRPRGRRPRVRHRGGAAAARRARGRPSRPRSPDCRPTCCSRCPGSTAVEVVVDGVARTSAATAVRRRGPAHRRRTGRRPGAVAQRSGELPAALLADRPVEERVAPRLDGDLGGAAGRRRRPAAAAGRPGRARADPQRRAAVAAAPADRPVPARPRPAARRARRRSPTRWSPRPPTTFAELRHRAAAPSPCCCALVPRAGLAGAALDAALGAAVLERLRAHRLAAGRGRAGRPAAPGAGRRRSTRRPTSGWRSWPTCCRGCCRPAGPAARTPRRSPRSASGGSGSRRRWRPSAAWSGRASWWGRLYAALDGADREELAALPVPLADGRTAHGPAGVLLPDAGPAGRAPGPAGPAPGRARGGRARRRPAGCSSGSAPARRPPPRCSPTPPSAVPSRGRWTPWTTSSTTDRTRRSWRAAVLALVAAARPAPGELPWLAELALPDAAGGWAPAGELVLPGSRAGRRPGGGRARRRWTRRRPRPPIPRRCGRSASSTRSRWSAARTPTTWTSTPPTGGPTPCSTGCRRTRRRRSGRR